MQSRRGFMAILLVAIAVFSALIGLVIGRSGGERGRQLMEETVSGEEVSFGEIRTVRFYKGPRIAAQFEYWLEGARNERFLVSCCNRRNQVVFSVYYTKDGEARVHDGMFIHSPIKYHLEHGTAYAGANNKAPAAWSLCGNHDICTGKGEQGPQVYHIERGRVYAGPRVTTEVLLTADDENIENDPVVSLLVPILVERLWEQW